MEDLEVEEDEEEVVQEEEADIDREDMAIEEAEEDLKEVPREASEEASEETIDPELPSHPRISRRIVTSSWSQEDPTTSEAEDPEEIE